MVRFKNPEDKYLEFKELYVNRRDKYTEQARTQRKTVNSISHTRLLVFIAGAGFAGYLYWIQNYYLAAAVFAVTVILFLYLIKKHQDAKYKYEFYTTMALVNERAIERLRGKWTEFEDKGEEFVDDEHNYSQDIDIFGQGSLFQWTNFAITFWGRQRLAEILANPINDKEQIYSRQKALEELAAKLDWRQKFFAEGLMASGKMHDPEDLCAWAESGNDFYLKNYIIAGFKILPFITISLVALSAFDVISVYIPLVAVIIHILLLWYRGKERAEVFELAYKYRGNLRVYTKLFSTFENEIFKTEHLQNLQKGIKNNNKDAHSQIMRLEGIVDAINNRNNLFYMVINILILGDYQNLIKLERWKRDSGASLRQWFKMLAEAEALSGLSNIRHDNPQWVFPTIVEDQPGLWVKEMGHPLITEGRVCNDLAIEKAQSLLIITGSNMSGKTTLLRSVGINLVLAYAGAPVCAEAFRYSFMEIHTSMRTKDNLEKNLSSFYAELLRVSNIVKAAERAKKDGTQILVLLDEIFKGTNSIDRNTGAKILLKKLSGEGAFGLVSTHDLDLGHLEQEEALGIKNFNFREHYQDGEIFFDYTLRPGVSTTRNAIYLMKMVGIDVDKLQESEGILE